MAWTGSAVVEKITDGLVRITGVSLASGAAGTIGLYGGAGDIDLPDDFNPKPYRDVDLADALQVVFQRSSNEANALVLQVEKTASPFLVTITNRDGVNASGDLELYVRYH